MKRRSRECATGGRFAASEEPEMFAADVREFVRHVAVFAATIMK